MSEVIGADAAALKALAQGLYVDHVSFGSDHIWTATVRRRHDLPFSKTTRRTLYVRRGRGKTIEAAIRDALLDQFEDVLG